MNESIRTINGDVAQAEFGARGQGIVWAVVGSGVESSLTHFSKHVNLLLPEGMHHLQFGNEEGVETPIGQAVQAPSDLHGHGTSVAAVIAGESSDDSGNLIRAMAPECKILSMDVMGEGQEVSESTVLAALRAIEETNAGRADLGVHGVLVPSR